MIYIVQKDFNVSKINPFTGNKYDNNWILYYLTNSVGYDFSNGRGEEGLYTLKVSKNYSKWKFSLMDFIEFHEQEGRNIILFISNKDFEKAKIFYKNHKFNENKLREYESKIMVHSTTTTSWQSIKKDGYLKSWNILKSEKKEMELSPIGEKLGDPKAFRDYIMFSNGGISSEIVVLSKQFKQVILDENKTYETGVRLYFDMEKIAKDGLLIRDGCHLKVKNSLSINKYLVWIADWKNSGLDSKYSTPKKYTNKANKEFNEVYGEDIFELI
ncbi:MAG: hypothetical protein ACRCYE_10865 [Sarcina sp.]